MVFDIFDKNESIKHILLYCPFVSLHYQIYFTLYSLKNVHLLESLHDSGSGSRSVYRRIVVLLCGFLVFNIMLLFRTNPSLKLNQLCNTLIHIDIIMTYLLK